MARERDRARKRKGRNYVSEWERERERERRWIKFEKCVEERERERRTYKELVGPIEGLRKEKRERACEWRTNLLARFWMSYLIVEASNLSNFIFGDDEKKSKKGKNCSKMWKRGSLVRSRNHNLFNLNDDGVIEKEEIGNYPFWSVANLINICFRRKLLDLPNIHHGRC